MLRFCTLSDCPNIVPIKKARRRTDEPRPPRLRSAVTNGTRLFVDGAHEGPWARRFRDLVHLHEDDLGPRDSLSEGQLSLCRRVATIEVELEQMEGKLSKGENVDLDLYNRMTGTLARTIERLGLKRAPRVVDSNPLADHFARPPVRQAP